MSEKEIQLLLSDRLKLRKDAVACKLRTQDDILPFLIVLLNELGSLFCRLCRACVGRRTPAAGEPGKILVIRADRIGDMVLATPMFRCLRERYPKAHITCMASTLSSQLIEGNPYIDSIMVYDPPWFDRKKGNKIVRDYLSVLRLIRTGRFDMAIDLRGNVLNFFFLMLLGRIRQRVSFDAAFGDFLLTRAVPFKKDRHETEYFLEIVKALGGKPESAPQPDIMLSDEEKGYAEQFLRSEGISRDDLVIALHPGAGKNRVQKRWPEERCCELGQAIVKRFDAKIVITGSEAEINLASRIRNRIGRGAILAAGKVCHLKRLAAVLKECALCVGTSTGTIHVAAAVGTPVIVLCGPEDPHRWRPLGDNNLLIKKEVPCRPCREKVCRYDGRCLKLISAKCVLEAAKSLLANRIKGPSE